MTLYPEMRRGSWEDSFFGKSWGEIFVLGERVTDIASPIDFTPCPSFLEICSPVSMLLLDCKKHVLLFVGKKDKSFVQSISFSQKITCSIFKLSSIVYMWNIISDGYFMQNVIIHMEYLFCWGIIHIF